MPVDALLCIADNEDIIVSLIHQSTNHTVCRRGEVLPFIDHHMRIFPWHIALYEQ